MAVKDMKPEYEKTYWRFEVFPVERQDEPSELEDMDSLAFEEQPDTANRCSCRSL